MILSRYLILVYSIALLNCSYSVNKTNATAETSLKQQSISGYDSISTMIIGPNCLSCHANATGNRGGLNLENYESVKLKLNQIYLRSIERQDMPPGGLDPSSREALKNWIENGAAMQSSLSDVEINGALTWKEIKKIVQKKCSDCHSSPNPEGDLDLTEYKTFKLKIEFIFNRVFVIQDMPLAPYPSLSLAEKNALLKWISQGFPE